MEGLIERWVAVRDNPKYEVSNQGQVRRAKDGKILKQSVNQTGGYLRVALDRKKYYVHRLVASSFGLESNGSDVRHLDGDHLNNALPNLLRVDKPSEDDAFLWPQ